MREPVSGAVFHELHHQWFPMEMVLINRIQNAFTEMIGAATTTAVDHCVAVEWIGSVGERSTVSGVQI